MRETKFVPNIAVVITGVAFSFKVDIEGAFFFGFKQQDAQGRTMLGS